ncbi:hypothetical protein GOA59_26525 [Sinorhizobium meliloti]|uniref:HNH endonuclease n=1 Tax=Rhizobium meliloti TaxID=382 RepID=UPI00299E6399|nr:hypothetical protein [Sinorhizobium meliloti]MDW9676291.1 hypothetical protein [Sinorhizobium meliloti]MDW9955149.1 hypothetical protein [Sinorhizobium meliloti]MDX0389974.1 hypothetical protein [Sinorhizobium meliloti]
MRSLPVPTPADGDDNVIEALCQDPIFAPGRQEWRAAYAAYRAVGGDPWAIDPLDVEGDLRDRRYKLYDGRRNSSDLRAIRDDPRLNSCPMCGSPVIGSLDHYLPRAIYSEFSIMRANLVPACTHCNSSTKGTTHRGEAESERFIHPYFDAWADEPVWHIEIDAPYNAATFRPAPNPDLGEPRTTLVQFHLKNVLGKQFKISTAHLWATYHRTLAVNLDDYALDAVIARIDKDRQIAEITAGTNSWDAAFYRGLRARAPAIEHVRTRLLEFVGHA